MKCCVWPSCPGAAADPQEPNQTHLQSGAEASAPHEVSPVTAPCVDCVKLLQKERRDVS